MVVGHFQKMHKDHGERIVSCIHGAWWPGHDHIWVSTKYGITGVLRPGGSHLI